MANRTDQLIELMNEHRLTIDQVAKLLNRSPQTVRIWRCQTDKRAIPDHSLELLRAKVDVSGPRVEIPIEGWPAE